MTNIWMQTSKLNSSMTASTNHFFVLGTAGGLKNTTEASVQTTWRTAGVFSNLYCRITANTAGTAGTLSYRSGGVSGNSTLSVSGSSTGEFSDSTHTDTVSAGNQVNYIFTTGTSTPSLQTIGMQFAPTTATNTVNKLSCNGSVVDTSVGTTYYQPLVGDLSLNTTEANAQFKNKATATLQNMYAYVSANTLSVATIKSRIGGADGNLVISIGSGATGAMEDTTHTDSIVSGNLVNTAVNSTVTTSITVTNISIDCLTTNRTTHYIAGVGTGTAVSASTSFRLCIAGSESGSSSTEAFAQSKPGLACTLSNLEAFVSANTLTATSTLITRIGGANGNQTISYTSGVTGYQEDTTHSDTITSSSEVNYLLTTGGTGTSISFSNYGMLATYPALGAVFRKTLSGIGSKVGSRQVLGW